MPAARPQYDHQHRTRAEHLKARAIAEGWPCPRCGRTLTHNLHPELDHITPIAHGGDPHGPTRLLCRRCNRQLGAKVTAHRRRLKARQALGYQPTSQPW